MTRRPDHVSDAADRPFRDDREQRVRARQAAEALFSPKLPPAEAPPAPTNPPVRQPRVLKPEPAAVVRPSVETAATPEPTALAPSAAIPPPHVARIRSWLRYGMTIAQVAKAYRVPVTEIKRLLGKP
jgi:hypothetical protein